MTCFFGRCVFLPGLRLTELAPSSSNALLIDGYRRVKALKRLGADTALVQCWHCPVGPALAQMLAHSFSRAFDPMEEALMLRELIDSLGLQSTRSGAPMRP